MKKLAVLATIATTPIVILYGCTKPSESPSALDASIAADPVVASSSAPGMNAPPTTPVIASANASTSTTASSSASASAPSKRQACEALQHKVTNLLATGRACTTTADCDVVQTGCGLDAQCGAVVAKTRKPDVEKTSQLFYAKNCLDALPPQACATCPMPPTPKCVNGQCD